MVGTLQPRELHGGEPSLQPRELHGGYSYTLQPRELATWWGAFSLESYMVGSLQPRELHGG